jgi:ABC-2 type transport system ATP-binding protein
MIETVELTKTYSTRRADGGAHAPAVDRLNLSILEGEVFGLLGPNGAGKTTTIGMLTTGVVPTSGAASIAGLDVATQSARVKRRIGVVSQTNTLDRSLTVYKNLYHHGRYFAMSAAQARVEAQHLLERVHLADRRDTPVASLSGGMAQRLMIARAVMHRPAVLFLDEPTTGLDPQSRLDLWQLVRELNHDGQTVLLTTHNMDEADRLCGRLAIMDHGHVLALDTPDALKRSLAADLLVSIRSSADYDHVYAAMSGHESVMRIVPSDGGAQLHVRGPRGGLLPRLMLTAEAADIELTDISLTEPSLEDVFLTLTGRDLRE